MSLLQRPKWVDDWRRCWRLTPMRVLAIGGAVQGAVVTCPAAISDHLPAWVLSTASTFSFVCIIAAGLGIGKRTRPEDDHDDHHGHL